MAEELLPYRLQVEQGDGVSTKITITTSLNPEKFLQKIHDKLAILPPKEQEIVKQALLTGKAIETRNIDLIRTFLDKLNPPQPGTYNATPISLTCAKPKNKAIASHIEVSQSRETQTYTIELQFEQRLQEPLKDACLKHEVNPGFKIILISDGGVEIEEDGKKWVMWKWDVVPPRKKIEVRYELLQTPSNNQSRKAD